MSTATGVNALLGQIAGLGYTGGPAGGLQPTPGTAVTVAQPTAPVSGTGLPAAAPVAPTSVAVALGTVTTPPSTTTPANTTTPAYSLQTGGLVAVATAPIAAPVATTPTTAPVVATSTAPAITSGFGPAPAAVPGGVATQAPATLTAGVLNPLSAPNTALLAANGAANGSATATAGVGQAGAASASLALSSGTAGGASGWTATGGSTAGSGGLPMLALLGTPTFTAVGATGNGAGAGAGTGAANGNASGDGTGANGLGAGTGSVQGAYGFTGVRELGSVDVPSGGAAVVLPADTFQHNVQANGFQLSALMSDGSPLPNWVTFDSATGTFQIKPPVDAVNDLKVTVTARDRQGNVASTDVVLKLKRS